mmetsp:Transcript_23236/g.64507  ORF Transcript_23236/g.64507 Transcript_23236/m.64507 type:complete len:161 (-) Transcript_23236:230-712(-)
MGAEDAHWKAAELQTSSFKKVRDFWERNADRPPDRPLTHRSYGGVTAQTKNRVMLSGLRGAYTPRAAGELGRHGRTLHSKSASLGSHPLAHIEEDTIHGEDDFKRLVEGLRGDMLALDTHFSKLNRQMKVLLADEEASAAAARTSEVVGGEHCRRASCQL